MAIIPDKIGSRVVRKNADGMVGTRIFIATKAQAFSAASIPEIGTAWPETTLPNAASLKVEEYIWTPLPTSDGGTTGDTYTHYRVEVIYRLWDIVVGFDFGGELINTGLGKTWLSDDVTIQDPQGTFFPETVMTLTGVVGSKPFTTIENIVGTVNKSIFKFTDVYGTKYRFGPETVLLESPTIRYLAGLDGSIKGTRVIYRLKIRRLNRTWQDQWRPDLARWDRIVPDQFASTTMGNIL